MYNDQLVYKVVIWAFIGNSLWTEKIALTYPIEAQTTPKQICILGGPNHMLIQNNQYIYYI